MPDKKSRGISNLANRIPDVPDAPTVSASNVGTSRAYNNGAATVTITSPTGGLPSSYSITTTPTTVTTTATSSPATITGLSSATSYTVTVTPSNVSATGTATTSSSFTATTVPATPSAPTATDAGSGRAYNNGSASVSFTAPATGGSSITGYTVTSTPGSYTGTGASSPISITGLQSATSYTFTVSATNVNGTSSSSSASGAITASTVPQAPTIGTFTDGGTGTTGTLSFTANATGGSSITNYKVSTDNSTYTALSPAQTSSPLTLSGLTVGTATYYIKAVNTNGDSSASSGVSGTVLQPSAFESIASFTLSSNQSTITFSSIPQTYNHLQLRILSRSTRTAMANLNIQINSNAGTVYTQHELSGDGATVTASGSVAGGVTNASIARSTGTDSAANIFGVSIIDFHEYASTSKNKTIRSFYGIDNNSATPAGTIGLRSVLYIGTDAISTIALTSASSTNFITGSTFALYGIKGS